MTNNSRNPNFAGIVSNFTGFTSDDYVSIAATLENTACKITMRQKL